METGTFFILKTIDESVHQICFPKASLQITQKIIKFDGTTWC
jgi:hypothetical protein